MPDMTLAIRIKADGTAEFVSSMKAAEAGVTRVGEAGRKASDDHAAAQARLNQIIAQTSTPMERLKVQLEELESLKPFATSGEQVMALERALASVRGAMRAATDDAKVAAAAHAQIAEVMEYALSPVERLRQEMTRLENLRPFATTTQEAMALENALAKTSAALAAAEEAANPLAVAAKRDAEALRELVAQLDPTEVAARKFADAQRLLDKALAGEVSGVKLSAEEHAALSRTLRAQHGVIDGTTERIKLQGWQITNLSYQLQDAAVQLVGGQNPFIIMAQQGPQATSAVGGFGNAVRLLATPMALAVAGGVALAAGMALVMNRAAGIGEEVRGLSVALKAMNPQLDTTGERLRVLAARVAELRGVSRDDAMAAVRAVIGNDAIRDEATLERIAGLAQDVAAVRGGAAASWAEKLSEATAKGIAGLRALDDQINYLTPSEREQIAVMAKHADQAGALALAMGALENRYGGAVKNMRSEGGNAFRDMARAWDELVDHIAKSDPVQVVMRVGERLAKAGSSLVTGGGSAQERRAVELAAADTALRVKQQQLEDAVSRGAKGAGVDMLRRQVLTLQDNYYRLAQAATAAAVAEERALNRTPPPHRAANDITPQVAASAAQVKWINEQESSYSRLNEAMKGTPVQRQLNIAALNAEREAIERGFDAAQKAQLVDLRRREALLQINTAINDQSAMYSVQVTGCFEIDEEASNDNVFTEIILGELGCL